MTLNEAIHLWIEYRYRMRELRLVATSTVENQSAIAIKISDELHGIELADLRKSHIELWMGGRLQTCQPVTVRGEMNVLRQMLNWFVDEQLLVTKPRMPTLSVANVETTLPSDEAFLWVLANVGPPHSWALEFMMLTGLAPHELERVQVRDLTYGGPGAGSSMLLGIGQRPDFAVKQASRRRWVPINARAAAIWYEATAGMTETQQPFPRVDAMQKAIRRAVAVDGLGPWQQFNKTPRTWPAGAQHVTPKSMRKWFASKVANDQPEHVLQKLMGHAPGSPITRQHYVRTSDKQASEAVAGVGIRG